MPTEIKHEGLLVRASEPTMYEVREDHFEKQHLWYVSMEGEDNWLFQWNTDDDDPQYVEWLLGTLPDFGMLRRYIIFYGVPWFVIEPDPALPAVIQVTGMRDAKLEVHQRIMTSTLEEVKKLREIEEAKMTDEALS